MPLAARPPVLRLANAVSQAVRSAHSKRRRHAGGSCSSHVWQSVRAGLLSARSVLDRLSGTQDNAANRREDALAPTMKSSHADAGTFLKKRMFSPCHALGSLYTSTLLFRISGESFRMTVFSNNYRSVERLACRYSYTKRRDCLARPISMPAYLPLAAIGRSEDHATGPPG